jgi:Protein of unknown function (DUF1488)
VSEWSRVVPMVHGVAEDLNKVLFPMKDGATGAMVDCRVSEDVLRKLSGGGSSITSLDKMFEEHRDRIEDLLGQKYDIGHHSPQISSDDV